MGGYLSQQPQEQKVYIERLYISRVSFTISFLPATWAGLTASQRNTAKSAKARIAGWRS